VYAISARFTVPEPAAVVQAVLTDYPNIPRFMPSVRTSRVLEQTDDHVRLEQEAVSKFMMFSRTVHLVLDVEESDGMIRFRDGCHKSFVVYDGSWTITSQGSGTELIYELAAKPAFSVPGMVLKRLLERDSREMIDGLRKQRVVIVDEQDQLAMRSADAGISRRAEMLVRSAQDLPPALTKGWFQRIQQSPGFVHVASVVDQNQLQAIVGLRFDRRDCLFQIERPVAMGHDNGDQR